LQQIEQERLMGQVLGGTTGVLGAIVCPSITALVTWNSLRRIGRSGDASNATQASRRGRNIFLACAGLTTGGALGVTALTSPATLSSDHPAFLALFNRLELQPGTKEAEDMLAEIRSLDPDDFMELLERTHRRHVESVKDIMMVSLIILMMHAEPNTAEFLRKTPNLSERLAAISAGIDQQLQRGQQPGRPNRT
jgi:hypothetical protein